MINGAAGFLLRVLSLTQINDLQLQGCGGSECLFYFTTGVFPKLQLQCLRFLQGLIDCLPEQVNMQRPLDIDQLPGVKQRVHGIQTLGKPESFL